jgi:hypothetical protein
MSSRPHRSFGAEYGVVNLAVSYDASEHVFSPDNRNSFVLRLKLPRPEGGQRAVRAMERTMIGGGDRGAAAAACGFAPQPAELLFWVHMERSPMNSKLVVTIVVLLGVAIWFSSTTS